MRDSQAIPTNQNPDYPWIIMAVRSAASIAGPAQRPHKRDGEVERFETFDKANARADELRATQTSNHVFYYPILEETREKATPVDDDDALRSYPDGYNLYASCKHSETDHEDERPIELVEKLDDGGVVIRFLDIDINDEFEDVDETWEVERRPGNERGWWTEINGAHAVRFFVRS